MSKITFRADDDLIRQLEEFDASKSEVMRDALRAYLNDRSPAEGAVDATGSTADADSIDALLAERIDAIVADRLDERGAFTPRKPQDVNVNITLDGDSAATGGDEPSARETSRKTQSDDGANASDDASSACKQCGEDLPQSAVYCPNCGEKASHRVFCECGDELRSDWAFCPGCGRRTPAAEVLGDG
jgi:Arc/MetJ-type ribon-helix-helix transcriptional regulator